MKRKLSEMTTRIFAPCARAVALLLAVAATAGAWAVETMPEQARTAAQNWIRRNPNRMQASFKSWNAKPPRTIKDADGRAIYHVVDMADGGFVVTSGDTRIDPIIAFSSSGDYNSAEGSPLEALLAGDQKRRLELVHNVQGTVPSDKDASKAVSSDAQSSAEAQWAYLLEDDALGKDAASGDSSISDVRVPALLATQWDQSTWGNYSNTPNVYNYYTPNNYVCGCVATAGAQIMKYWEYPSSVDSFTGTCTVDGVYTTLTSLGGAFAWDKMPLSFSDTPNPTLEQRQAIGKLTYNVGVAVEMDYTAKESGANTPYLTSQLRSRFGYASGVFVWFFREVGSSSSVIDFQNALYASLDAGMPVSMSIGGLEGGRSIGHSIVADGYGYSSNKRYTHLNMGWSGLDDIWYNVPDETLTDRYKFDTIRGLGINIHPYAQGDVISGRVLNSGGAPVSGATVKLFSSSGAQIASTNSNSRGIYSFRVTSAGSYSLSAQRGASSSESAYAYRSRDSMGNRKMDFE